VLKLPLSHPGILRRHHRGVSQKRRQQLLVIAMIHDVVRLLLLLLLLRHEIHFVRHVGVLEVAGVLQAASILHLVALQAIQAERVQAHQSPRILQTSPTQLTGCQITHSIYSSFRGNYLQGDKEKD